MDHQQHRQPFRHQIEQLAEAITVFFQEKGCEMIMDSKRFTNAIITYTLHMKVLFMRFTILEHIVREIPSCVT